MPPPPLPSDSDSPETPAPDYDTALREVVRRVGLYPIDAYLFVNDGVSHTVRKTHGRRTRRDQSMHITGAQLCHGLRELAIQRWGLLAGTVLRRWGVTSTMDFGRIVFAMVENELMSKTEEDRIEDFRDVFDFDEAFDAAGYVISARG